jgi:nucleotide-binding universal stress UspA family protein
MFQRILLAWDGSRPAERAFNVAIDLARRYDAELVAASVAHSPAHAETEADRQESVEAAREYLSQTLGEISDRAYRVGVPFEHVIIEGDRPADNLLDFAHDHAFDLFVSGHHRNGRAGRFLVHGLAERLVSAGTIPVLIVSDNSDR